MLKKMIVIHTLLIAPLFFYNIINWERLKTLQKRQEDLQSLTTQAQIIHQREKSNERVQNQYRHASEQYLYSEVESLSLLNSTQKIQFIESPISENSFYVEKDEGLAHSIQVDLKDLKSILKKIETPPTEFSTKPHLIFSDFSLKKNSDEENILYDLNFKLIKREYI